MVDELLIPPSSLGLVRPDKYKTRALSMNRKFSGGLGCPHMGDNGFILLYDTMRLPVCNEV